MISLKKNASFLDFVDYDKLLTSAKSCKFIRQDMKTNSLGKNNYQSVSSVEKGRGKLGKLSNIIEIENN